MQENYKLDVRDRKILVELDEDARQSNNQIGKKVGLSKEVVKYRIDKMIDTAFSHSCQLFQNWDCKV